MALSETSLGIAVGDVVGNGLSSAIVMGQLRSALGAAAATRANPVEVLQMVDAFADRLPGASCATAVYAVFDASDRALTWCCAGHPPPIVFDDTGAQILWDGRRPPLGVPPTRSLRPGRVALASGALVMLYTDGLIERRNEPLDIGLERPAGIGMQHRHLPVGEFADRVLGEMAPMAGTEDDIAVVVMRMVAIRADLFVDAFAAKSRELVAHRRRLRSWLESAGLRPPSIDEALLSVGEACTNAIEHGSHGDGRRIITVEACLRDDELVAAVGNSGHWESDSAESRRHGRGRGLQIMKALADDVSIRRSRAGTTVTLHLPRMN
jgi:anti-sigma regulatory factor (Ser/Thr protein kinase)